MRRIVLKLCFESDWYFCNITESELLWKRYSRNKVPNNHFVKSVQMFFKKDVSQKICNRKTPVFESLLLIKLQSWRSATLWRRDSTTGSSCEYCGIFDNSFFYRTPPMAAFVNLMRELLLGTCQPSVLNQKHNVGWFLPKRIVDIPLSMFFTYN